MVIITDMFPHQSKIHNAFGTLGKRAAIKTLTNKNRKHSIKQIVSTHNLLNCFYVISQHSFYLFLLNEHDCYSLCCP